MPNRQRLSKTRPLAANCHLQSQAFVPHPRGARPSRGTKDPLTRPSSHYVPVSHKEAPDKEVLLDVNFETGER